MKKLLAVCESYGGGVHAYLSQLCNDMADDFDVYLAVSLFRPTTPKNYKELLDPRVHVIPLKYLGAKSIINIPNDIMAVKELRSIERELQPDIIHLHSSIAGGIGRLAFKGKNNTVIYSPHGYAHICMGPGLKSKIYWLLEKILGKTNCMTLTCCKSEDEVAKTLCSRTAYIETGINLADLSKALDGITPAKHEKFTVFSLGSARVQKQPQVFNRIAELVPEANFLWIGNAEHPEVFTAPNLKLTGWMDRHDALAMAKGCDAFILCSLGEAIAMSVIENMYLKKLVLVSDVVGNNSVIHDGINGYVCTAPEEYAAKIKAAMKHFPYELTEKAYEDVINIYNTDVMRKKFIEFYNSL